MRPPRGPVFLERQSYRSRRVLDAARILPVAGLFLFLVPVILAGSDGGAPGTGPGGLYLFGVWGVLILAAALLSRRLTRAMNEQLGEPSQADADAMGAGARLAPEPPRDNDGAR